MRSAFILFFFPVSSRCHAISSAKRCNKCTCRGKAGLHGNFCHTVPGCFQKGCRSLQTVVLQILVRRISCIFFKTAQRFCLTYMCRCGNVLQSKLISVISMNKIQQLLDSFMILFPGRDQVVFLSASATVVSSQSSFSFRDIRYSQ